MARSLFVKHRTSHFVGRYDPLDDDRLWERSHSRNIEHNPPSFSTFRAPRWLSNISRLIQITAGAVIGLVIALVIHLIIHGATR
jgi:hypothetical protein